MSLSLDHFLIILGMCLVTFVPRFCPLLLLSSRSLHPLVERWLKLIPAAVLAALLAPGLLTLKNGEETLLFISSDNILLLASIPCFLTGWFTKNFFATVIVGILAAALLRHFLGVL